MQCHVPRRRRVRSAKAQSDVGPCCGGWRRRCQAQLCAAVGRTTRCTTRAYSSPPIPSECRRSAQRPPGVAARGSFAARLRRRVACAMSDAAPAKAQKTERSGTPHRGRFDQKAKGQNKRGHHNKVGCRRRLTSAACGASPPLTSRASRLVLRRATKATPRRHAAASMRARRCVARNSLEKHERMRTVLPPNWAPRARIAARRHPRSLSPLSSRQSGGEIACLVRLQGACACG